MARLLQAWPDEALCADCLAFAPNVAPWQAQIMMRLQRFEFPAPNGAAVRQMPPHGRGDRLDGRVNATLKSEKRGGRYFAVFVVVVAVLATLER